MPSSSRRLTSDASVKRAGGEVAWPLASRSGAPRVWPSRSSGSRVSRSSRLGVGVVGALDVGPQVAGEGDRAPRRGELGVGVGRGAGDAHGHGSPGGVGHLRGDRPLPDEVVEPQVVARELPGQRVGGAEPVAGRADGLVGLLGVLDLAGVRPRRLRKVLLAVELGDLGARRGERGLRQRRRVGAHVGDVAALVETLGDPHHLRRARGAACDHPPVGAWRS